MKKRPLEKNMMSYINMRISASRRREFERAARAMGLSLSAWVRLTLFAAVDGKDHQQWLKPYK